MLSARPAALLEAGIPWLAREHGQVSAQRTKRFFSLLGAQHLLNGDKIGIQPGDGASKPFEVCRCRG